MRWYNERWHFHYNAAARTWEAELTYTWKLRGTLTMTRSTLILSDITGSQVFLWETGWLIRDTNVRSSILCINLVNCSGLYGIKPLSFFFFSPWTHLGINSYYKYLDSRGPSDLVVKACYYSIQKKALGLKPSRSWALALSAKIIIHKCLLLFTVNPLVVNYPLNSLILCT